ncbi:MAG TPA: hypothetical protein VKN76_09300, partial [Kiloniellaceae bacterium]|nr:hypothetical protein [Kiloniellaceae bacterium]
MCRFFGLLFAAAYFSLALWLGGAAGLSATPDDGLRAAPLRSAAAAAPDRLSASLMVEPAGRFLAMTTPESTTAEPECRIAGGCVSGTEPVPGPVWLVV